MDEHGGSVGTEARTAEAAVRARVGLGVFLGWTLLCLAVSLSRDPNPPFVPPDGATSDLDVFRLVVHRVRDGESFYDATQTEFRSHGYPTRSPFNWRTPCYAWFLGRTTGDELGRWLLMVGVVTVIVLGYRDLVTDCGLVPGSVGGVLLVGATAWGFGGQTFLFTELWAAMLITLSIVSLRRGWTAVGVAAGLVAVFYRELAVPYAAVALGLAAWRGRRREAAAWGLGLLAYAAFFAWHASVIQARLTDADKVLEGGWVRFGGIRFLLETAQTNVFLMPLPLWVTALFLATACLGLAGMRGPSGSLVGLAGLVYLAAYSVVGNPFNFYWGFVDAPLLAIGVAHAPATLRGLIPAAFPRPATLGHRAAGVAVRS